MAGSRLIGFWEGARGAMKTRLWPSPASLAPQSHPNPSWLLAGCLRFWRGPSPRPHASSSLLAGAAAIRVRSGGAKRRRRGYLRSGWLGKRPHDAMKTGLWASPASLAPQSHPNPSWPFGVLAWMNPRCACGETLPRGNAATASVCGIGSPIRRLGGHRWVPGGVGNA